MKKLDLIAVVSVALNINMKDARNTVDCVLGAITKVTVKRTKCAIPGFGKFSVRRRRTYLAYDITSNQYRKVRPSYESSIAFCPATEFMKEILAIYPLEDDPSPRK